MLHVLDQFLHDYAIPVFYHALPRYLKNDLKRLGKRAMAIIIPAESYFDTLDILSVPSFSTLNNFVSIYFTNRYIL